MTLTPLHLSGAYQLDLEKHGDNRGFFARYYCKDEFEEMGLVSTWIQMNISVSCQKGTLRGLHFQRPPVAEAKVVRCLRGGIWDVIVDLRKGSNTFGKWAGVELNEENRSMIYVPKGFAHGFQTLTHNAELLYMHSEPHRQECEGGVNLTDDTLAIQWPLDPTEVSERDLGLPNLPEVEPIQV